MRIDQVSIIYENNDVQNNIYVLSYLCYDKVRVRVAILQFEPAYNVCGSHFVRSILLLR
jgi:hypothetical protein